MGRYLRNIRNPFELPDAEELAEEPLEVPVLRLPFSYATNNNFFGSYAMPIRTRTEGYLFNGIRIARYLLNTVGAVESDEAVNYMANGLASVLNVSSTTSLIPIHGPLVIGCVVDGATGLIVGYGVGQYQPHPVVNRNGEYTGQAWHREVRGFAFDDYDDSRNIVTQFITGLMFEIGINYNNH